MPRPPISSLSLDEFLSAYQRMAGGDQTLSDVVADLQNEIKALHRHGGSRFVGNGADPAVAQHVASGGSIVKGTGRPFDGKTVDDYAGDDRVGRLAPRFGQAGGGSLAKSIVNVAQHRTEGLQPAFSAKALAEATDAAGGFLLVPEIADSVMMLIRNRVAVAKMPVTHVQPKSKAYVLPGLASGASASWLAENGAIPASGESFQVAAQMQPRPLGSLVAVSNRLLENAITGNPSSAGSAEQIIRSDIADLMAVTMDAGLLLGDAAGPAPKGCSGRPGPRRYRRARSARTGRRSPTRCSWRSSARYSRRRCDSPRRAGSSAAGP